MWNADETERMYCFVHGLHGFLQINCLNVDEAERIECIRFFVWHADEVERIDVDDFLFGTRMKRKELIVADFLFGTLTKRKDLIAGDLLIEHDKKN